MEKIFNNLTNSINSLPIYYEKISTNCQVLLVEFEKSYFRFCNDYKLELNNFINVSTILVFAISMRKKGLFSGVKNCFIYYSFSSLLLHRDNLNPYAKYKK